MDIRIDINTMNQLWDRFDRSTATEMSVTNGDLQFVLKKQTNVSADQNNGPLEQEIISSVAEKETVAEKTETNTAECAERWICAPLAGTFYRAPSPEADPFVKLGQRVNKGDVIGIVEAMKMMNEITADADGFVRSIEAEDGLLVGFGQRLLALEEA